MLLDRVSALKQAGVCGRQSYRHILGQPSILSEEMDGITCETPFMVLRTPQGGSTDLFASGRYVDRYRIMGQYVKILQRVVVCDASSIDPQMALPL